MNKASSDRRKLRCRQRGADGADSIGPASPAGALWEGKGAAKPATVPATGMLHLCGPYHIARPTRFDRGTTSDGNKRQDKAEVWYAL